MLQLKYNFSEHQQRALDYTLSQSSAALYMEMRLRKTRVAIASIIKRDAFPCLVVCPYSAFDGWRKDIKILKKVSCELIGERQHRLFILKYEPADFFIINKEGFLSIPEIALMAWKSIVLDEAQFINNPKSKVSKFFTKNFRFTPYKYILTGTPAEADYNLIQQFRFLDFFTESHWDIRNKFFIELEPYRPALKRNMRRRFEAIKQKCFWMKREDIKGGKKDKVYIKREIYQDKKFFDLYDKIFSEFIIETKNYNASTVFACERFLWLRKLCSGFISNELVFKNKLNELKYLLNGELKGQQVIICCMYRDEVVLLQKELKGEIIFGDVKISNRDILVKRFQQKKFLTLIIQPTTVKYGRDLSSASTIIFYSTPTGETRKQFEDRIVALDKFDTLLYIDLICKDTIEEEIYEYRLKNPRDIFIKIRSTKRDND